MLSRATVFQVDVEHCMTVQKRVKFKTTPQQFMERPMNNIAVFNFFDRHLHLSVHYWERDTATPSGTIKDDICASSLSAKRVKSSCCIFLLISLANHAPENTVRRTDVRSNFINPGPSPLSFLDDKLPFPLIQRATWRFCASRSD